MGIDHDDMRVAVPVHPGGAVATADVHSSKAQTLELGGAGTGRLLWRRAAWTADSQLRGVKHDILDLYLITT